jgi:hypothetical protein
MTQTGLGADGIVRIAELSTVGFAQILQQEDIQVWHWHRGRQDRFGRGRRRGRLVVEGAAFAVGAGGVIVA